MSVCGQTEEESGSEEPGGAGAPLRDLYEQKAVSKVVRVLTVLAYLLSVSLAAILLSVYYVCVWQSPKLPPLNDTGEGSASARRADHLPYNVHNYTQKTNYTRGGSSAVSETVNISTPAELSSLHAGSEPPDPTPPYEDSPFTTSQDNVTWSISDGHQTTLDGTDQR